MKPTTGTSHAGPDLRYKPPPVGRKPFWMLGSLQSKPMYQGTVDPADVKLTRKRNKVARKQRILNKRKAKKR